MRGLRIGTSQLLIGRLARLARMMQEAINSALKQDACERQDSMLCHHLQEVREELIKDLPAERFADM